jgi:hypothetical protein
MGSNDKQFKVTNFLIERSNRIAREEGRPEPYPATRNGIDKFFEDFSKSPTMQAYKEKHKGKSIGQSFFAKKPEAELFIDGIRKFKAMVNALAKPKTFKGFPDYISFDKPSKEDQEYVKGFFDNFSKTNYCKDDDMVLFTIENIYKYNYYRVKIEWNFGNYPLWVKNTEGNQWTYVNPENYKISKSLFNRMKYWCAWINSFNLKDIDNLNTDLILWHCYGRAIATDLQLELGDDFTVFLDSGSKIELYFKG